MINYLAALALNLGIVAQLHSQGYIVPMGVITNYSGAFLPGEISVLHDPINGSYTGFALIPNGETPPTFPYVNTFQFQALVDVSVRVFLVSPNDPISLQAILSSNYTELTFPNSIVFTGITPIYVGLYTGNELFHPTNGIYSDPLFGWAELENYGGTIELLNSALEYQGGGIFAGTENIIPAPEPTTFSLIVSGALGLIWRHRVSRKALGIPRAGSGCRD